MLHGLSRGIIARIQGGSFKAGFMSGLSSALDVGTKGYGGFVGRTVLRHLFGSMDLFENLPFLFGDSIKIVTVLEIEPEFGGSAEIL